ncbi:hypothetical protein WJX72_001914 [[Myrmecia] bisecta]|uniref:DDH domain-containing protein n=1 Tax=[Myrmecia] bisecta TaxID=41462 RepID=A0AAW1R4U9_9CHLO
MTAAREFFKDTLRLGRVVLAPDRDADGLCSGAIALRTLQKLGHPDVQVCFLGKGQNVHQPEAIAALAALEPKALIVLDQGSRTGALLPAVPTLVIDHHASTAFPDGAQVLSAYGHEPVATTSLLAYICCSPLHPALGDTLDWLAILGTFGDLGTAFKWVPPFPDLGAATRKYKRTKLSQAVSLLNAPRRTAKCDAMNAWRVLLQAQCPADIADGEVAGVAALQGCRDEVTAEVNRCARTPPRFSEDGRVALVTISSGAQIHPLIATRWARTLKGKTLQMVMVANTGYLPGHVNFAARICDHLRGTDNEPNLIEVFKAAASKKEGLLESMGENFARGHAQASGGIVVREAYDQLLQALGFGEDGKGFSQNNGRPSGGSSKRAKAVESATLMPNGKKAKTLTSFGFSTSKKPEQ